VHYEIPISGPIQDAFIGAGICYLLRAVFVYACEDCAMNLPEFNDIQVQEKNTDGLQSSDHTGEGR
jgi:hypothetical protein